MMESSEPVIVPIDTPDKWRAFDMLVNTQLRHPLDFLRESVLNSFDANASRVRIDLMRDSKGTARSVRVTDNGVGAPSAVDSATQQKHVLLVEDEKHPEWGRFARPDIEYIPKHAADSLKKAADRATTTGQFGIGIYTFWGLGETLTLTTRALRPNSSMTDTFQLVMQAEKQETTCRRAPLDPQISATGTTMVVDNLWPAARALLSRDRVVSYLSVQLREKLLSLKESATVVVTSSGEEDRKVEPKRWGGRPWSPGGGPKKINTRFGVMKVELYLLPDDTSGDTRVSVTSSGAYGYQRITDLEQLNMYPWNTTKVQGNIDYPAAPVKPSRDGFLPGKMLDEFIRKVVEFTPILSRDVQENEKKVQSELDKKTQDRLIRAFVDAWRELDPMEYDLFRTRGGRQPGKASDGLSTTTPPALLDKEAESTLALSKVVVSPAELFLLPNQAGPLRAVVQDSLGRRIRTGVTYRWSISKGTRTILFDTDPAAPSVSVMATSLFGEAEVRAKVEQGNAEATGTAKVFVVRRLPRRKSQDRTKSGIPPPTPENRLGESWRSKYDADLHQIIYNTAHLDYRRSVTAGRKEEYILTVMAKELLLLNYPRATPSELLERMVEVIPTVLRHY